MTNGNRTVKRYSSTKKIGRQKNDLSFVRYKYKTFQTNKIAHDLNSQNSIRKSRVFHCLIYFCKHYRLMPQWKPSFQSRSGNKSIISFCVFDLNDKLTIKKTQDDSLVCNLYQFLIDKCRAVQIHDL